MVSDARALEVIENRKGGSGLNDPGDPSAPGTGQAFEAYLRWWAETRLARVLRLLHCNSH